MHEDIIPELIWRLPGLSLELHFLALAILSGFCSGQEALSDTRILQRAFA